MKPFVLLSLLVLAVFGHQWVRIRNHCEYDIDLIIKSEEDNFHRKVPGRGIYCDEATAGPYMYFAAGEINMTAYILTKDNLTDYWLLAKEYREPKVAIRPFWSFYSRQCGPELACDRQGCPGAITDLKDRWDAERFTKGKVMEIRYCYDQPMEDLPCPHQPPPDVAGNSEFDD